MAETKKDKDSKTGRFLEKNKSAVRHGGHSFAATGKVPSVRGVRQLKKDLERIRADLEVATPKLNIKKTLVISQIVRTEGMIRLIEIYLKKSGIVKPGKLRAGIIELQPALATTYLALMNSQRCALALLGLNEQKLEEIKAPYEIVEGEK